PGSCRLARPRTSPDDDWRQTSSSRDQQARQRLSSSDADPRRASGLAIPGEGADVARRMAARIARANAYEHGRGRARGEDGQDHLGRVEKRAPLPGGGDPAGWMIRVRPKGSALQASVVCEWTEKMA